jgi:hypothetical protein
VYPVSLAATAHPFSPNIRGKGNNDERLHYAHYLGGVALLRLAPAAHLSGRACAKGRLQSADYSMLLPEAVQLLLVYYPASSKKLTRAVSRIIVLHFPTHLI